MLIRAFGQVKCASIGCILALELNTLCVWLLLERKHIGKIPQTYKESKANTAKIMSKCLASATVSSQDFGSTGAGADFALDLALALQARRFGTASEAPEHKTKQINFEAFHLTQPPKKKEKKKQAQKWQWHQRMPGLSRSIASAAEQCP